MSEPTAGIFAKAVSNVKDPGLLLIFLFLCWQVIELQKSATHQGNALAELSNRVMRIEWKLDR